MGSIPKQLSIFGKMVPVYLVEQSVISKLAKDKDSIGLYIDGKIYITKTLEKKKRHEVLSHEVFHAVLDISGLNGLISGKIEEAIVTALESLAPYLHFEKSKK